MKGFPMLVLSRLEEESVIITVGEIKIRIVVTEVRCANKPHPKRVRLAFDAPSHVKINREEIQEKIDENKRT